MIRPDTKYPDSPTQAATAQRHAWRRDNKPMTEHDADRINAAAMKRQRKGRAAD